MTPAAVQGNNNNTKMETDNEAAAATFPPPLVTETLQYRLATGNIGKNGGQRGSLTRCAQKFGTFRSKLLLQRNHDTGENKQDTAMSTDADGSGETTTTTPTQTQQQQQGTSSLEAAKQDLIQDLGWYQLEFSKLLLMQQNWQTQVTTNANIQKERRQEIDALQNQVQQGQSQAKTAQDIQNSYKEYEALAKLVNDNHPKTTTTLQQEIDAIQKEIESMEEQQAEIDQTLQVRETQFHLLLQYMMDLKRSLKEQDDVHVNKGVHPPEKQQDEREEDEDEEDDEKPAAMQVDMGEEDDEDGLYGDL